MNISDLVDKENELKEARSTAQRRNGRPTREAAQSAVAPGLGSKEKRGLSDPQAKKKNHTTRPWTAEEDKKLSELIESMGESLTGTKTWSKIASHMNKRTGKQCRERWHNQLKPGIRRESWTEKEERILHEAHRTMGNKWVQIAELLPGRTDNSVKNHWNSMIRKRQRRQAAGSSGDISGTASPSDEYAPKLSRTESPPNVPSDSVAESRSIRKRDGARAFAGESTATGDASNERSGGAGSSSGANPLVTLASAALENVKGGPSST